MCISTLGRLKTHKIPHIHSHFTTCMSLNRLHLDQHGRLQEMICLQLLTLVVSVTNFRTENQILI